jgi:hypothetical protein
VEGTSSVTEPPPDELSLIGIFFPHYNVEASLNRSSTSSLVLFSAIAAFAII